RIIDFEQQTRRNTLESPVRQDPLPEFRRFLDRLAELVNGAAIEKGASAESELASLLDKRTLVELRNTLLNAQLTRTISSGTRASLKPAAKVDVRPSFEIQRVIGDALDKLRRLPVKPADYAATPAAEPAEELKGILERAFGEYA